MRHGRLRIGEKRLYIFAGFDDYRIATQGQVSLLATAGVGVRFFWQSVPAIDVRSISRFFGPPAVGMRSILWLLTSGVPGQVAARGAGITTTDSH